MKTLYLITGAAGHVGSAVCLRLKERGEAMRALLLPGENSTLMRQLGVEICFGDVTKPETLDEFFTLPEGTEAIVLHCAGIVEIADKHSPAAYGVNVRGTINVLERAKAAGVKKFVYVSSVHAMPDTKKGTVKTEIERYDSRKVEGAYSKSKAIAARIVLEAAKEIPAVVVLPSGIIGPYNGGSNHLVRLVKDYANGKFPACVKGGYDFVDVRDVADGIVAAADRGRSGESYILSGGYHTIRETLDLLRPIVNGKRVANIPHFLAMAAAPFAVLHARLTKKKPLFSPYALRVILENGCYSHEKATRELGFAPRDFSETLADTVQWLRDTGAIVTKQPRARRCKRRIKAT